MFDQDPEQLTSQRLDQHRDFLEDAQQVMFVSAASIHMLTLRICVIFIKSHNWKMISVSSFCPQNPALHTKNIIGSLQVIPVPAVRTGDFHTDEQRMSLTQVSGVTVFSVENCYLYDDFTESAL